MHASKDQVKNANVAAKKQDREQKVAAKNSNEVAKKQAL